MESQDSGQEINNNFFGPEQMIFNQLWHMGSEI